MRKHVKYPNLPDSASAVIIGSAYADVLAGGFEKLGIDFFSIPENPFVDRRLRFHADLSVCHVGEEMLFAPKWLEGSRFASSLSGTGLSLNFARDELGPVYPMDCAFNVCVIGGHFIFSPNVSSSCITDYLDEKGLKAVPVRQGYCKCSVCPVDSSSVITSDKGIARALRHAGFDVLEISSGHIELDGYQYGFIGGAAFKSSKDSLAFTGRLDRHPDKERILSFLRERGIRPQYLSDRDIFDVGSIIPILEK